MVLYVLHDVSFDCERSCYRELWKTTKHMRKPFKRVDNGLVESIEGENAHRIHTTQLPAYQRLFFVYNVTRVYILLSIWMNLCHNFRGNHSVDKRWSVSVVSLCLIRSAFSTYSISRACENSDKIPIYMFLETYWSFIHNHLPPYLKSHFQCYPVYVCVSLPYHSNA